MSFRTHLRGDPTLYTSGKKFIILQQQLQGYKAVDPPAKNQKTIASKLVLHIYKKQYTHLSTSIRQMIAVAFFFGTRLCEYSATPKEGNK